MKKSDGYFTFGGKNIKFINSKENPEVLRLRCHNFLISDEYKEEIKELLNISDVLMVFIESDLTEHFKGISIPNSMISMIYEETNIIGMFEVKFRTNMPIEEIREIKLKKLIND
jgi:hypothetical protein